MPPAGEDQARARICVVEHRLGGPRRVAVDTAWDQYREHPVAPRDRTLDHLAVVGRAWDDGDASLERVELFDALCAAHANNVVAAVQRMLDHVLTELAGSPNDTHLHVASPCIHRKRDSVTVTV